MPELRRSRYAFDAVAWSVSPAQKGVLSLQAVLGSLRTSGGTLARRLHSLLGMLESLAAVVLLGEAHRRRLGYVPSLPAFQLEGVMAFALALEEFRLLLRRVLVVSGKSTVVVCWNS